MCVELLVVLFAQTPYDAGIVPVMRLSLKCTLTRDAGSGSGRLPVSSFTPNDR